MTVRWVIVRLRNAGWVERPGISRAGNERLRRLLVTGATAVIRFAVRPGNKQATEWLVKLLARKPRKLVAVALANKIARRMTSGEVYRRQPPVAGAAFV
jgi:transposase